MGLSFSASQFCPGQVPVEVGGQHPDDNHGGYPGQHGGHTPKPPQSGAQRRPGQGGASVDVLDENIGHLLGQQVPEHAAPHAGDRSNKDQQEEGGMARPGERQLHARHGKDAQSQGVHPEQQPVVPALVVHQHPPHPPGEEHRRGRQGQNGVGRVPEGHRGRQAQNQVPDDPAAGGGGQAQNAHPEDVHIFIQADHGPGGGKGQRPYDVDNKNKRIHTFII